MRELVLLDLAVGEERDPSLLLQVVGGIPPVLAFPASPRILQIRHDLPPLLATACAVASKKLLSVTCVLLGRRRRNSGGQVSLRCPPILGVSEVAQSAKGFRSGGRCPYSRMS